MRVVLSQCLQVVHGTMNAPEERTDEWWKGYDTGIIIGRRDGAEKGYDAGSDAGFRGEKMPAEKTPSKNDSILNYGSDRDCGDRWGFRVGFCEAYNANIARGYQDGLRQRQRKQEGVSSNSSCF